MKTRFELARVAAGLSVGQVCILVHQMREYPLSAVALRLVERDGKADEKLLTLLSIIYHCGEDYLTGEMEYQDLVATTPMIMCGMKKPLTPEERESLNHTLMMHKSFDEQPTFTLEEVKAKHGL